MRIAKFLPLLALPLLTACVDDRVAFEIPGGNEIITLIREQPLFWEKKVDVSLVVARMPDCMRRHSVIKGDLATKIELWQYEPTTYIIKSGQRMWVTETRTCEGFAVLDAMPPNGMGTQLGTWRAKEGEVLEFTALPAAKPAAR